ncbi:glycoside hydrolase family 88 protein [Niabella sp. CJ426]|uniref:glycoside hydrolase family 88 protein n=1 Tax=Niabella sp. CJ426 TaxID=3393740 RepID=UPI003D087BC2
MKKVCFFALLLIAQLSESDVVAQKKDNVDMAKLVKDNFAFADSQYRYMMKQVPQDKMPQSYEEKNKKFVAYQRTWWCTGFYPGALWYIYEQTGDPVIKSEAERTLKVIEPNKTYTGNHDLGFMMYCSFGNAYRITRNESYKDIIIQSAAALASRYRPSAKVIQSWNTNQYFKGPVIIDNMMNLELLYWTSLNGGDAKYKDIAVTHSNTTLQHHFRPDFSSYHVIDYNMQTGDVIRKATWQGAADCSAWSRGQGWGLYGYVMMYRFSKDQRYLDHARKIASFILGHPNLPQDKIPYWDFDAPYIPNAKRDASAGAVIASALLELGQYTKGAEKESYVSNAKDMIISLSGEKYKAKLGENGGFLLKHSTGALPSNSEVDVPLIYADYYYLEALKRYKDWYL